ncbi:MAG: bifunctional hydroxymethylpyrimidine kinase/phosphomethylpyrimidine kinase [Deltaproteobacteria bacterium]|nr:bifunctional hydroxymethylpyrimidine kinase/phosphomethylpyrimidine kinase [Deltaproteobacteria bacterium]
MSLDAGRLMALLDDFGRVRLLVLGDLVLDEYVSGDVERISPEAPVPVVHVRDESLALGGAGNVARNVVALGGQAALCSLVGDDAAGRSVAELLEKLGVDPRGLVAVEGRATPRKTRVVARSQQIVRFDRETLEPAPPDAEAELRAGIERALAACDAVVVADYGKGALSAGLAAEVMAQCRSRRLPVILDPKAALLPWRGVALVKPNLREAEALSGVAIHGAADLARAATALRDALDGAQVVVTRGMEGMTLFEGGAAGVEVGTLARDVFDVQGAGDTVSAALALALRAGASLLEAAVLANTAAGVVVGKVGTATASRDEVRALLPAAVAAAGAVS